MISWNYLARPAHTLALLASRIGDKKETVPHPSAQEIPGGTLRDSKHCFDISTGMIASRYYCNSFSAMRMPRVEPTQCSRARSRAPRLAALSRALFDILETFRHAVAEIFQPFRDIRFRPPLVVVVRRAEGEGCVISAKVAGIVFFQ